MLWKWLTYDVDIHKRRNKIAITIAVWMAATIAWLYLLPLISPSGTWLCTDAHNQQDYVIIHENASVGYTVIVMSSTGKLDAKSKDTILTAWLWRLETLHNYQIVDSMDTSRRKENLNEKS